jgi:MFS family permease
VLVLFLAASAAPTPLYRVYQARWGFSASTLTAVFAVYVLFLLATVLIFGSLSDHVGRRPVIITALAVDTAACILFLLAHGVGALFFARALQGIAVGLAANALGAALLDLRPAGSLAPLVTSNGGTVGLALGALGTSLLVQYGPFPAELVWWLLLGAFLATILLVAAIPEPGTVRPGALASLRPDVSVPRSARGTFARAVPCLVAVWALGGFYLSLGPSLAAQLSGSPNLVWGGVITFLLTGLGAVTSLPGAAGRRRSDSRRDRGQHARAAAARYRAGRTGLWAREPGRLPRDHGPGCGQQPGRADRRDLHRQLPRVRPPSPDRWRGDLASWPARHRAGLFRRDRAARRGRRGRRGVRGQ